MFFDVSIEQIKTDSLPYAQAGGIKESEESIVSPGP